MGQGCFGSRGGTGTVFGRWLYCCPWSAWTHHSFEDWDQYEKNPGQQLKTRLNLLVIKQMQVQLLVVPTNHKIKKNLEPGHQSLPWNHFPVVPQVGLTVSIVSYLIIELLTLVSSNGTEGWDYWETISDAQFTLIRSYSDLTHHCNQERPGRRWGYWSCKFSPELPILRRQTSSCGFKNKPNIYRLMTELWVFHQHGVMSKKTMTPQSRASKIKTWIIFNEACLTLTNCLQALTETLGLTTSK